MTKSIYSILEELSIPYEKIEHAPVFTSEQARRLVPEQRAASAKNLFLTDRKRKNHYLLVFDDQKSLEITELAHQIGSSRLSLASSQRLSAYLGVDPGSVSLLALVNDPDLKVQLLIDQGLWDENYLQCHPLKNTETLVIAMPAVKRFLEYVGHIPRLIEIPELKT